MSLCAAHEPLRGPSCSLKGLSIRGATRILRRGEETPSGVLIEQPFSAPFTGHSISKEPPEECRQMSQKQGGGVVFTSWHKGRGSCGRGFWPPRPEEASLLGPEARGRPCCTRAPLACQSRSWKCLGLLSAPFPRGESRNTGAAGPLGGGCPYSTPQTGTGPSFPLASSEHGPSPQIGCPCSSGQFLARLCE